jgi:arachidonate 5-lipoxygenase
MVEARFNYYMIQSGKDDIRDQYNHFQSLDDYAVMFGKPGDKDFSPPLLEHSWRLDEVFAKQFLAGINPLSIIAYEPKIRDLPKVVNLTKANVEFLNQNVLNNKTTFEELKSKRRLFFADYEILDGITRKDSRVFYSPVVLFYLNENDVLMPLAIQLTRNQTNNRLYTPADSEVVWILARMFAMEADGLYHEMVQHLCFTHLTVESIIIGLNRQLPADHPILKFMEPHFYNTIAINDLGRNTLLAANSSTFDRILACGVFGGLELMNKAYVNQFNLSLRAIPRELESRGFPQPTPQKDNLPGYLYRDDSLRIWWALKRYVVSVLELPETYNGSDANVANDFALQGVRRELSDPKAANVPGVPELNTVDSLADFLTTVLFMASAEHSAVNFGQYDFYSFIPNRPLILTKPMPDDLSLVTNQYILSALPTYDQAKETISTARVLSLQPEVQIGVYTGKVIGYVLSGIGKQVAYPKQYSRLVDDLNALQDIMKTRNAGIIGPVYPDYDYLEPIRIASSIAV